MIEKKLIIKYTREEGLLIRIAMLLERRSYLINSFAIFRDRKEIEIFISGKEEGYDQIIKQIKKLIDVEEVSNMQIVKAYTMEKEMLMSA